MISIEMIGVVADSAATAALIGFAIGRTGALKRRIESLESYQRVHTSRILSIERCAQAEKEVTKKREENMELLIHANAATAKAALDGCARANSEIEAILDMMCEGEKGDR